MMKSLFPVIGNDDFLFPSDFFDDAVMPLRRNYSVPKVDVEDTGDAYVMTTDLPGVAKEDIKLTYDDDVLTLSACHEEKKDEQQPEKNYVCKERVSRSFCRQFTVSGIDKEKIQASFKDGVLTVTLPKEAAKPAEAVKTIDIQ